MYIYSLYIFLTGPFADDELASAKKNTENLLVNDLKKKMNEEERSVYEGSYTQTLPFHRSVEDVMSGLIGNMIGFVLCT